MANFTNTLEQEKILYSNTWTLYIQIFVSCGVTINLNTKEFKVFIKRFYSQISDLSKPCDLKATDAVFIDRMPTC